MFTGIVQAIGKIEKMESNGGDLRIAIGCGPLDLSSTQIGDSIAVNGVCLTAIEIRGQGFSADVSRETLQRTSLGQLTVGSPVNLETALTLGSPLGGHLVSGHVDGLATLLDSREDARSWRYRFSVDPEIQHYIAVKGSVTLDGCSLTVNGVDGNEFDVNIVPHTQQKTVFQFYEAGSRVNIEVDIIARYLERLLQGRAEGAASKDQQLMQTLIKSGLVRHE